MSDELLPGLVGFSTGFITCALLKIMDASGVPQPTLTNLMGQPLRYTIANGVRRYTLPEASAPPGRPEINVAPLVGPTGDVIVNFVSSYNGGKFTVVPVPTQALLDIIAAGGGNTEDYLLFRNGQTLATNEVANPFIIVEGCNIWQVGGIITFENLQVGFSLTRQMTGDGVFGPNVPGKLFNVVGSTSSGHILDLKQFPEVYGTMDNGLPVLLGEGIRGSTLGVPSGFQTDEGTLTSSMTFQGMLVDSVSIRNSTGNEMEVPAFINDAGDIIITFTTSGGSP